MKEPAGLKRRLVRMVELHPDTTLFGLGFLPVGLLFLVAFVLRELTVPGLSWVIPTLMICMFPYYLFLAFKILPIVDRNSSKGSYIAWHIQRYKETFNTKRDDS